MTRRGMIADLEAALDSLVAINERVIASRAVPPLERAAVSYEAAATETWRPIPAMLEAGRGDAEDLACWRAAELRAQGKRARVVVLDRGDGALTVVVRTAGVDEDPTGLVPAAPAPASSGPRGRRWTTPAAPKVYERAHHDFREWPLFFLSLWDGTRTHEIRRDDRKPAVNEGDTVTFHEWMPDTRRATGRWIRAVVGHVTRPGTVGSNATVPAGLIVFSIRELARSAGGSP